MRKIYLIIRDYFREQSAQGFCLKHDEYNRAFPGCMKCWKEHGERIDHEEREEKINLIKEAIRRADEDKRINQAIA